MATKLDSTLFSFNGKRCEDFGIINAQVNAALFSETYLTTRQVKEEKASFTNRSYLMGYDYTADDIPLTLVFESNWKTEENYLAVQAWLSAEGYHPITFDKFPDVSYLVTYSGSSTLSHNGLSQGYINITFHRDSPFAYGSVVKDSVIIGSKTIHTGDRDEKPAQQFHEIYLKGTEPCLPVVRITKYGVDGDISVHNRRNNTKVLLPKLALGDYFEIDCDLEMIESKSNTIFTIGNLPQMDLRLEIGRNKLLFTGEALIEILYQPIYLQ